ncbi:Sjogren's syndrome/scleroderma autoantigen 1 family protein [Halorubrum trapanicum]|uniref:Sjogren's syndrome/scleroderma autoantigen 1 family protein n=1 Tax=Halorubrum trapanicum TaxID=29284 RepID=UPI000BBAD2FB|nr:Sjogren's syndrome/scleroderma autoantigen 1 family protein [Halorubrum trapanicum]
MSDGFDKEAEREKLREKFAEDEKKREHTQQMSELLLKGATMTNRHCGECGDPIFRYDGREFCPTCGNEAGGAAEAGEAPAEAGDAPAEADGASVEAGDAPADAGDAPAVATGTSTEADAEEGVDAAAENGAVDSGANEPGRSESPPSTAAPQGSTPSQESAPSQDSASPRRSSPQRSEPQRSEPQQSVPSRSADDAEGVGAARASLTRTLTRFARAAEETDDPRRARDHLEAAREAAEALAALNR